MNARAWKGPLLSLAIAAAAAPAADGITRARPPRHAMPEAAREAPATHNMLLVGEHAAYLSHLPMFEALDSTGAAYATPHRFQVILEVTFSKNGEDVTQRYLDDRKSHPGAAMYTLNPARFVLPDLFPQGSQPGIGHFAAVRLFRGHLERGGQPIPGLDGVEVNVRRVIRATTFAPAVGHPRRLTCILFGKGNELFLAHSITHPPDFDQVLSVRVDGHAFTDDELARGVEVTFPDLADTPLQRIRAGQSATGEAHVPGDARAVVDLPIRAGAELYFEEGELRMPATFDDTPEEIRSGFKG